MERVISYDTIKFQRSLLPIGSTFPTNVSRQAMITSVKTTVIGDW